MHSYNILLVKADSVSDARIRAEEFLQYFEHSVWDWYTLGGRWAHLFGAIADHPDGYIKHLPEVIDKVKEWVQDPLVYGEKMLREANKRRKKLKSFFRWKKHLDTYRYGYLLSLAGDAFMEKFNSETLVYNTEDYSYKIPNESDIDNYYAVIVDTHK